MTQKQFTLACQEATAYLDQDAFVSDMLLSSAFLPADPDLEPDLSEIDELRRLWTAAVAPFRVFLAALGLSQADLSRSYLIPIRTVQDWATDRRDPPPYVRIMIARLEGYVNAPEL